MWTVLIYAALPASVGAAAWAICHGNTEPNPAPLSLERAEQQADNEARCEYWRTM